MARRLPCSVGVSGRTYRALRGFADTHGLSVHEVLMLMLNSWERGVQS